MMPHSLFVQFDTQRDLNSPLLRESADFSPAYTGTVIAICDLIMLGSHPISIYFS